MFAAHYSPQAIVVMKATAGAFDHLFSYVDELLTPSETLLADVRAQREKSQKRFREWHSRTGFKTEDIEFAAYGLFSNRRSSSSEDSVSIWLTSTCL